MTAELPERSVSLITTEDLAKEALVFLKSGALEILPRQSKTLALMRGLAPDLINVTLSGISVPVG